MAVEHAMFTFDDLKVTSRDDRMTDRMTTKVLSSRPRIICGKTNNNNNNNNYMLPIIIAIILFI